MPKHIAIIMDGNGRWAAQRGLPRTAGHHAGMAALRRTIRAANDLGIKVLTVYAFSTENWNRPAAEVDFLMRLPSEFLRTDLPELVAKNVKVMMSGSYEGLPQHTIEAVNEAINKTANNTGMILNFALNYGSRAEIVKAVREISQAVAAGSLQVDEINEEMISNHLYTAGLPDPDLLIRPSGEIRLSNFLLWQLAYAELWFVDIYWPDFTREHLLAAIEAFSQRDRRFGAIKL
ncbi:MAG: isoprenyl transferase [Firmicutes bacterium]|nr:isoprenyl transferase [Bacillota bacterium]